VDHEHQSELVFLIVVTCEKNKEVKKETLIAKNLHLLN